METSSSRRRNDVSAFAGFASGALVVALGLMVTTQFIAWSFANAPALGAPWILGANLPYARDLYPLHVGIQWLARIDVRCLVRSMHDTACSGDTFAMLRVAHGILEVATLAAVTLGSIVAVLTAAVVQRQRHASQRRPAADSQTGQLFQLLIGARWAGCSASATAPASQRKRHSSCTATTRRRTSRSSAVSAAARRCAG